MTDDILLNLLIAAMFFGQTVLSWNLWERIKKLESQNKKE